MNKEIPVATSTFKSRTVFERDLPQFGGRELLGFGNFPYDGAALGWCTMANERFKGFVGNI